MTEPDLLTHLRDAPLGPADWQDRLASAGRSGMLTVNNVDPAQAPVELPTHITGAGDERRTSFPAVPRPAPKQAQRGRR